MTPQTRSHKKDDTESKIYRSKNVPQQAYFPHKRKTVRRPSPPTPRGSDKRQMIFLPEKMRENNNRAIKDSDDDEEDENMEQQNAIGIPKRECMKRGQDTIHGEDKEGKEPVRPTRKRKRKDASQRPKRRQKQIKAEPADEHDKELSDLEDPMRRRLVRQSTMTQLVEGRRPMVDDDAEEPKFRPVKRSPRLSWVGNRRERTADKKQRTLTQMVPGMRPTGVMSDDDMEEALGDLEAKDDDSQKYDDMVAQRLGRQGLHRVESHDKNETNVKSFTKESVQSFMDGGNDTENGHKPIMSVENTVGADEDHGYQPTEYIDSPATRRRRISRKQVNTHETNSHTTKARSTKSSKAVKPRFGLLSTPEKQHVREIPSSQSPAESPLFTQMSSPYRSPLKGRSRNATNILQTPSKLKKVSFQEFENEQHIVSPILKKFCSAIQDSEDEDNDSIEEIVLSNRPCISAGMQSPPTIDGTHLHGKDVGIETQAILEQIDQACTHVDKDVSLSEKGTQQQLSGSRDTSEQQSHLSVHTGVERESSHDECLADLPPIGTTSIFEERQNMTQASVNDEAELIQPLETLHSTPPHNGVLHHETLPSTPMVLEDESSDETEEDSNHLLSSRRKDSLPQPIPDDVPQSANLSSEIIQCPRSPSPNHETQQSHSSRAELQIQNEWFSYSQYVNARSPQPSSMHANHDTFSHIATPAPLHQNSPSPPPSGHQRSQATTIDEVTPRKDRTQRIISANVTPRRGMGSYSSLVSPSKLPALCIPSSFPDPMEAGLGGWSSPVLQETQAGVGYAGNLSWEEFSIPLPPPPEEIEDPWL